MHQKLTRSLRSLVRCLMHRNTQIVIVQALSKIWCWSTHFKDWKWTIAKINRSSNQRHEQYRTSQCKSHFDWNNRTFAKYSQVPFLTVPCLNYRKVKKVAHCKVTFHKAWRRISLSVLFQLPFRKEWEAENTSGQLISLPNRKPFEKSIMDITGSRKKFTECWFPETCTIIETQV